MAPFDVVLAKVRVGEAEYARPCVVLEVRSDGSALVLPCSTKFEYCRAGIDFEIHDYLPEFEETGLGESSYVIDTNIQAVPPERIRKIKGRLTADLARRFADWVGMPPPE